MKERTLLTGVALMLLSGFTGRDALAAGLRGSPASMELQHERAVEEQLEFVRSAEQVQEIVEAGWLVPVEGSADYAMSGVSFPYARPEVRLFIERLAAQYREATGSRLVVTSLTRPASLQPRNAHQLSVHPAGMAVDFRVPATPTGRSWLEKTLLQLEASGVADVTRERYPPHYHVAVFPKAYAAYVARANESRKPPPQGHLPASPSDLRLRADPVVPAVTASALRAHAASGRYAALTVTLTLAAFLVAVGGAHGVRLQHARATASHRTARAS